MDSYNGLIVSLKHKYADNTWVLQKMHHYILQLPEYLKKEELNKINSFADIP